MDINRKSFLKTAIAACLLPTTTLAAKKQSFGEKLTAVILKSMKTHAYEGLNDSTCKTIEAEVFDWAHQYVVSGEVVKCYSVCFVMKDDEIALKDGEYLELVCYYLLPNEDKKNDGHILKYTYRPV